MAINARAGLIATTIRDECIGRRLRQLDRVVTHVYNDALRAVGLTLSQLNVLVAVACHDGVSPGEIARALAMDKSTMSRTMTRMIDAGWLRLSPGRPRTLGMTEAGEQVLERAFPRWQAAQVKVESTIGREPVIALTRDGAHLAAARPPSPPETQSEDEWT